MIIYLVNFHESLSVLPVFSSLSMRSSKPWPDLAQSDLNSIQSSSSSTIATTFDGIHEDKVKMTDSDPMGFPFSIVKISVPGWVSKIRN